jgi:hypothetical protein
MKYLLLLLLLSACGKKGGGTSPLGGGSETLKPGEDVAALIASLASARSLPPKEVLRSVLGLNSLDQETLHLLDRKLSLNCSKAQGLCSVTTKDTP